MSGDDFGRLAYLVILGVAVLGWFIAENRTAKGNLGKNARMAMVWGLIFMGIIAVYGLWSDIRDDVMPRQSVVAAGKIEVPRGFDGHYHLIVELNDVPVEFIIDTGASDVVLSRDDAKRIGLNLNDLVFSGTANTANGIVRTADARVRTIRLGDISDKNVPVSVNGGEMEGSLLGMSYLQRFERIEITGDTLTLTR
ncbi:MAG: retropepsin-like aspartic protease family protein [Marinosulfonomonas sp.]